MKMDAKLLEDYLKATGQNAYPESLLKDIKVVGDLCFYREKCLETDASKQDCVPVYKIQEFMLCES